MNTRFFDQAGRRFITHGTPKAAATAADTLHADSGPLRTAGDIAFIINLNNGSDGSVEFTIQHRNALDNGTIEEMLFTIPANSAAQIDGAFQMNTGERITVRNVDAIGANGRSQVSIFGGLL